MSLDLVVLVPDKDIEQTLEGLLARPASLGIRVIEGMTIIVHPQRDPGVYHTAHELLRPYIGEASHALIVFDRAWEGAPSNDPEVLAGEVETRCRATWGDVVRCVCIEPEIESWVWSDSPHVGTVLGWENREELRDWLRERGIWPSGASKPTDPKAAFEAATRQKRIVPSSSIFGDLARKVALRRCQDRSFSLLLEILRGWFPPRPAHQRAV